MGHLGLTTVSTCSRRCLEETLDHIAQTLKGTEQKFFQLFRMLVFIASTESLTMECHQSLERLRPELLLLICEEV